MPTSNPRVTLQTLTVHAPTHPSGDCDPNIILKEPCVNPLLRLLAKQVFVITGGEGTLTLDGKAIPVKDGDLIHVPPGTKHEGSVAGTMKMVYFGIFGASNDNLFSVQFFQLTPVHIVGPDCLNTLVGTVKRR
jgi:hypothetical protein